MIFYFVGLILAVKHNLVAYGIKEHEFRGALTFITTRKSRRVLIQIQSFGTDDERLQEHEYLEGKRYIFLRTLTNAARTDIRMLLSGDLFSMMRNFDSFDARTGLFLLSLLAIH